MTAGDGMPPESTHPQDLRRRGVRGLRIATAAVGAAAVVGTGGITLAVAEPPAPPGEVDTGTPAVPSAATSTPPTESALQPPAQPPEPADPGPVDASSGAS